MDIVSLIIFFIYVYEILMILVFISPILSLLVLMIVPIASVYFLPQQMIRFFSIQQFFFGGVSVQNLHILLLIWSTIIGVVASTEIVSWYLLKEEKPAAASAPLKLGESQKSLKIKVENLLLKLGKIMSGKKS